MRKIFSVITLALGFLAAVSCGPKAHEYTEIELLLVNKNWVPDVNANIQSGNDALEDATGIKSDIQLQGDVKKIGDFFSGKYLFGKSDKDGSLVYSITTGKGFLSAVTGAGLWEMSEDGKTLFLTPWDYDKSEYAETADEYEIIELTEDKLVWKKAGSDLTSYFTTE